MEFVSIHTALKKHLPKNFKKLPTHERFCVTLELAIDVCLLQNELSQLVSIPKSQLKQVLIGLLKQHETQQNLEVFEVSLPKPTLFKLSELNNNG